MSLTDISNLDKVSIVGLGKTLLNEYKVDSISALATKLEVPLMSENRNRKTVLDRLTFDCLALQKEVLQKSNMPSNAAKEMIRFLLNNSGAVKNNNQRNSYAPWLKCFLSKMHEEGTSFNDIALLTGISIDTLEKFKDSNLENKSEMTEKHILIAEIWKQAHSRSKKSLETFWTHLGKNHDNLSVSYKEVRQILIDLGFYSPRGPKIADKGAQVKKKFEPHTMWEGDGNEISKIYRISYDYDVCRKCIRKRIGIRFQRQNVCRQQSNRHH
jgi:hypothetical protein